jgi:hypothetical protein
LNISITILCILLLFILVAPINFSIILKYMSQFCSVLVNYSTTLATECRSQFTGADATHFDWRVCNSANTFS